MNKSISKCFGKKNIIDGSNTLDHLRIMDEVLLCHWSRYTCDICKWYLISKMGMFFHMLDLYDVITFDNFHDYLES
jgi:hypothetical protein